MSNCISGSSSKSFYEASARERIAGVVDAGSFEEIIKPIERITSPHLAQLDQPVAFDDGAIIGRATLQGKPVFVGAQEGEFLGGAVGEVHGAKLAGLLRKAAAEKPAAVLLVFDSGGVRLHEANAGLIAVSEVIRALLEARQAGVPVIGLVGGAGGCFGGTGIVAKCCDTVIMSEEGRLAMSGPEVIETVHGVEEFDSKDRALVWRVTGGKHRYLMGDADAFVADSMDAFAHAAMEAMNRQVPLTLESMMAEQGMLQQRWDDLNNLKDGKDAWATLGVQDPAMVPMLEAPDMVAIADVIRAKALAGMKGVQAIQAASATQGDQA